MMDGLRLNRLRKNSGVIQQAGVIFCVAREPERRRMLNKAVQRGWSESRDLAISSSSLA
jgi:hypothetical protein